MREFSDQQSLYVDLDHLDQQILHVDFNNVASDGRLVKAALVHASGPLIPQVGEQVILKDGEGNRCLGWIERVLGPIAFVELDEATWVSGEEVVPTGLPPAEPVFNADPAESPWTRVA